jgi:PIN domain nuclease of toxin-antitoxin system
VFLWWRADARRLGTVARTAIGNADVVLVSAATAWEAAIKAALGRLRYPDTIEDGVDASGFEKLSITLHHADPFDRMLVRKPRPNR